MSYNLIRWGSRRATIPSLLGLPRDRLPQTDLGPQTVEGIVIFLKPAIPGSHKHRAMAHCPTCDKVVSIGRLAQHRKVHPPSKR